MTIVFAGVQLSITRVARPGTPAEAERELQWNRMVGQVEQARTDGRSLKELHGVYNNLH
ncbi:MAG: hypothetical protein K0R39_1594 [Symbiobacteriaceae bacterium]|jgi:hypothetical protein|nr:hypothetical protein [Symbiobacteriaceae bacterium]